MSVAEERYPELHRLIDRLEPEQAALVREQILELVTPPRGLSVLGVFDGPEGNLGEDSEAIIRREAGAATSLLDVACATARSHLASPGDSLQASACHRKSHVRALDCALPRTMCQLKRSPGPRRPGTGSHQRRAPGHHRQRTPTALQEYLKPLTRPRTVTTACGGRP